MPNLDSGQAQSPSSIQCFPKVPTADGFYQLLDIWLSATLIYQLLRKVGKTLTIGQWSEPKAKFSGTESPDPDLRESQICLLGCDFVLQTS